MPRSEGEVGKRRRVRGEALHLEFSKFALVGVANTFVSLAIYGLLLLIGIPYLLAIVPAYAAALLMGYTLNRRWTFRAGDFAASGLARYVTVQFTGLVVNLVAVFLFVERAGVAEYPAQMLALPLVAVTTFAGNRHWTFADR